ncbi:MAG: FMN-binding negative transcriptional regulator [Alphaproteobacteria bacterium]
MVYLPPAFAENDPEVLVSHIEDHEFGLLVSSGSRRGDNTELIASQIPFLVARRDRGLLLEGHIARANPQIADLDAGAEVLAIFTGPHAYISPSWYEAGPAVPTWNYASVHAYGTPRAIRDREWLRDMLDRLSQRHEARETRPWRMRDLPPAYLESMLGGIVGVEIAVTRLEGKFKLSQNRPAGDRPRIVAALGRRADEGSHQIAALMRRREATVGSHGGMTEVAPRIARQK